MYAPRAFRSGVRESSRLAAAPLSARATFTVVLIIAALAGTPPAFAHDVTPPAPTAPTAALDPGLGLLRHPVATRNAKAQAFFDQGLKLVFAFNHEAAMQSFQRAFEVDPKLAMAQWGIALALGPLQLAYAKAMKDVARRHPRDDDAAALYAESLMDLDPWKYWTADGKPADGTLEIVAVLERVLKRDPDHIGANHYYIHALEASPHPETALRSARRLETLAPSAGHLVHMSAHVYIRTGNYLNAAAANIAAVKADERRAAKGEQSFYLVAYYGHNLHFLAIADAFAGRSRDPIGAASKLYDIESPRVKQVPEIDGAMWHFARTLALAGRDRGDEARAERAKFGEAAATLTKTMGYGHNDAPALGAALLKTHDYPAVERRVKHAWRAADVKLDIAVL